MKTKRRRRPAQLSGAHFERALSEDRLLDAGALSRYLGISKKTLGRWVKTGSVPHKRLGPTGAYRFRLKEVYQAITVDVPVKRAAESAPTPPTVASPSTDKK